MSPAAARGWVLLLRGVNVGGRGTVPMPWLRETVEGLGLEEVTTHLNSGNVVAAGTARAARSAVTGLEAALAELAGRPVPVLLRSVAQLAAVVALDPFPDADPSRVAVVFLDRAVTAADRDACAAAPGPAGWATADGELVLHYPQGFGRLRPADEPVLAGAVTTTRNLRTTRALAERAAAL